jgi:hypothetical protein
MLRPDSALGLDPSNRSKNAASERLMSNKKKKRQPGGRK